MFVSLEALRSVSKKTIGTKQTMKAVQAGIADIVYLAEDAEQHVLEGLLTLTQEKNIKVVWVKSMDELGAACGIDVGSASASIIKE